MKKERKEFQFKDLSEAAQKRAVRDASAINLVEDWYKEITDAWNTRLQKEGFSDIHLHFTGFNRKGDGACFEGKLNLLLFLSFHNVRRMVRSGIDILLIRRVVKDNIKVKVDVHLRAMKEGASVVWNQGRMFVRVEPGVKIPEFLDPYTRDKIGAYVLNRCRYLSGLMYEDLKKKFDILISEEMVRPFLEAFGWRRRYKESGEYIPDAKEKK